MGGNTNLYHPTNTDEMQQKLTYALFKNHLLSGLATCDPHFPIAEWDCLLPQAELTINLLRNSHSNPKLSAWAHLHGTLDFNKTPRLPPGTKILIHSNDGNKLFNNKSWIYIYQILLNYYSELEQEKYWYLHLYIYICVCIWACLHVYMYALLYICAYIYIYI